MKFIIMNYAKFTTKNKIDFLNKKYNRKELFIDIKNIGFGNDNFNKCCNCNRIFKWKQGISYTGLGVWSFYCGKCSK